MASCIKTRYVAASAVTQTHNAITIPLKHAPMDNYYSQ